MSLALIALIILIGLSIVGALLHRNNIDTTYKKIMKYIAVPSSEMKQDMNAGKGDMKKYILLTMFSQQGSNFNALAVSSWLLLFVAAFYSFLLTPQISDGWTFLKVPSLASSQFGFATLGIIALVVGFIFVLTLRPPRVYGFYLISRRVKAMIMVTWVLLLVPIFISSYLATIYPYPESISSWVDLGFLILVVSQFLLLSPIYFEAMGVKI